MDDALYFSEQHLATREMVSQFARDEVAPVAAKHDADATFPWDNIRKMGELGLLGVPWSEELGGAGLDLISYMIVIHEMAKVDASHGLTISAHTTLGTSPIVRFGTDEQKRKYVPFLATGKVMGGFGLTEPEAGSDAGGTRSTAVRHGNCYVLNGVKRFITHGGVGEIFVVTAVTDPSQGTKGISSFILTKETNDPEGAAAAGVGHEPSLVPMPGFRAGKKEDKLGWRASDTCELIMEDVGFGRNRLGQSASQKFNHATRSHIGIAALSLGISRVRSRWRFATSTRKQFGQTVALFQGVQFQLSDMATEIRGEAPDVPRRVARAAGSRSPKPRSPSCFAQARDHATIGADSTGGLAHEDYRWALHARRGSADRRGVGDGVSSTLRFLAVAEANKRQKAAANCPGSWARLH
jgi:butyryl-CoA dehydrogenase